MVALEDLRAQMRAKLECIVFAMGVGRGGGDVFLEIVVNMLSIILSRPVVNQIQPDSATRVAVAITLPFSCNQLFQ